MGLTAIEPGAVRQSSSTQKRLNTSSAPSFSEVMSATNAPASAAVGMATNNYQASAVTSAAITGVAGAASIASGNSPYYYPGVSVASGAGYNLGNIPSSYPGSVPAAGIPGVPGATVAGAPSQDYMEKQALFTQMNDANWEMLTAQVTINNLSRDYQARSNILKTKSDTELNAVRNMRA